MFWKRKKSDFISLNLSEIDPVIEPPAELTPEPSAEVAPVEPVKVEAAPSPVLEQPKAEAPTPVPVIEKPSSVLPSVVPTPALPVEVAPTVVEDADEGFMKRFRKAITSTRENIATRLEDAVKGKKVIDAATLDELEEALIGADIGVQTTMEIIESVRKQVDRQALKDPDELKRMIKQHLLDILESAERARGVASETAVPDDVRPYVMMIVGVNGVGKTTTIGKLAQRIKAEGNDILICAADTFRAAASDQLAIWADRAGVPLIQQKQGTDPAAVLFDSLKAAKARNADVLIVDTAGRLHNKSNLMAELEKMKRIANREVPGAPHEVLLVVDAVTGQNGLSQAREFMKAADITGLVLTKLDGTAKGGIAVAIAKELNLPIRYCGIGEQADDLVVFDPKVYVEGLFE
ncbi:MAG TPA: signal recognition particle-docking protein FtsY [Blastocatellia bacterium]|nr:signal recognition particle-docking protein FtsY [Blastocatellia bacterium]